VTNAVGTDPSATGCYLQSVLNSFPSVQLPVDDVLSFDNSDDTNSNSTMLGEYVNLVDFEFKSLSDNTFTFDLGLNLSLPFDLSVELPKVSFDLLDSMTEKTTIMSVYTSNPIALGEGPSNVQFSISFPNVPYAVQKEGDWGLLVRPTPGYSIVSDFLKEVEVDLSNWYDANNGDGDNAADTGSGTDGSGESAFVKQVSVGVAVSVEAGLDAVTIAIPVNLNTPKLELDLQPFRIKMGRTELQLIQHSPQASVCRSMELVEGSGGAQEWFNVAAGPSEDCASTLAEMLLLPVDITIGSAEGNANAIDMIFQLSQPPSQREALESGLPVPETYDPWLDVMRAFLDGEEVFRLGGFVETVAEGGSAGAPQQLPFEVDSETISLLWNKARGTNSGNSTSLAPVASEGGDGDVGEEEGQELGSVVEEVSIRSLRFHTSEGAAGYNGGPGSDGECLGNPTLNVSCIFDYSKTGCPNVVFSIGADIDVKFPDLEDLPFETSVTIRVPPFVVDVVSQDLREGTGDAGTGAAVAVDNFARLQIDSEILLSTSENTLVRPSVVMPDVQSAFSSFQGSAYEARTVSAPRELLEISYLQNFIPGVKIEFTEAAEVLPGEGGAVGGDEAITEENEWTPGLNLGVKRTRGDNPHLQLTIKILDDPNNPIQQDLPFRVTSSALNLETLWVQEPMGGVSNISSLGAMGLVPLFLSPETDGRDELRLLELVFDFSSEQADQLSEAARSVFDSFKDDSAVPYVDLRVVSTGPGSFFEEFGAVMGFPTDRDDHAVCVDLNIDDGPGNGGGASQSESSGFKILDLEFLSLVENTFAYNVNMNLSLPLDVAIDLPRFSFDIKDDDVPIFTMYTNDTITIDDGVLPVEFFFKFPNVTALVDRDPDGTVTIQATPDYSIVSDFLSEVKLDIGILEDVSGVSGDAGAAEEGSSADVEATFLERIMVDIAVDVASGDDFVTVSIPVAIVTPKVENLDPIVLKSGRIDVDLLQHSPEGSKCRSMELAEGAVEWTNVAVGPSEDCTFPLVETTIEPVAVTFGGTGDNENSIGVMFRLSQPTSQREALASETAVPDEYDPWLNVMGAFRDGAEVLRVGGTVETTSEDGATITSRPFEIDSETLAVLWNSRALQTAEGEPGSDPASEDPATDDGEGISNVVERVDIRSLAVHTSNPDEGYRGGAGSDGACLGNPILTVACLNDAQAECPHVIFGLGADVNVSVPDLKNLPFQITVSFRIPPFVMDVVGADEGGPVGDLARLSVDAETVLTTSMHTLVSPYIAVPDVQQAVSWLTGSGFEVSTLQGPKELLEVSYLQNFLPSFKLTFSDDGTEGTGEEAEGDVALTETASKPVLELAVVENVNDRLRLSANIFDAPDQSLRDMVPFALTMGALKWELARSDDASPGSLTSLSVDPLYLSSEPSEAALLRVDLDFTSAQAPLVSPTIQDVWDSLKAGVEEGFVDLRFASVEPDVGADVSFQNTLCVDVSIDDSLPILTESEAEEAPAGGEGEDEGGAEEPAGVYESGTFYLVGSSVGDLTSIDVPCIFDFVCEAMTDAEYDSIPPEGFLSDLQLNFSFATAPVNLIFDAPKVVVSAWVQEGSSPPKWLELAFDMSPIDSTADSTASGILRSSFTVYDWIATRTVLESAAGTFDLDIEIGYDESAGNVNSFSALIGSFKVSTKRFRSDDSDGGDGGEGGGDAATTQDTLLTLPSTFYDDLRDEQAIQLISTSTSASKFRVDSFGAQNPLPFSVELDRFQAAVEFEGVDVVKVWTGDTTTTSFTDAGKVDFPSQEQVSIIGYLELIADNCLAAGAFADPSGTIYCPIAKLINSVVMQTGTAIEMQLAFRNYLGDDVVVKAPLNVFSEPETVDRLGVYFVESAAAVDPEATTLTDRLLEFGLAPDISVVQAIGAVITGGDLGIGALDFIVNNIFSIQLTVRKVGTDALIVDANGVLGTSPLAGTFSTGAGKDLPWAAIDPPGFALVDGLTEVLNFVVQPGEVQTTSLPIELSFEGTGRVLEELVAKQRLCINVRDLVVNVEFQCVDALIAPKTCEQADQLVVTLPLELPELGLYHPEACHIPQACQNSQTSTAFSDLPGGTLAGVPVVAGQVPNYFQANGNARLNGVSAFEVIRGNNQKGSVFLKEKVDVRNSVSLEMYVACWSVFLHRRAVLNIP
jgi:hypothetical protein